MVTLYGAQPRKSHNICVHICVGGFWLAQQSLYTR